MIFNVKINGNSLTIAQGVDLPGLYLKDNDLIHLGDHDNAANDLYICKMSRCDLYKKFSSLDYNLIDFGIPIELWNEAESNPMVMYYGNETAVFGSQVYDKDILQSLASKVYHLFRDKEYKAIK